MIITLDSFLYKYDSVCLTLSIAAKCSLRTCKRVLTNHVVLILYRGLVALDNLPCNQSAKDALLARYKQDCLDNGLIGIVNEIDFFTLSSNHCVFYNADSIPVLIQEVDSK